SVIALDLDDFKLVIDTLGHEAGDRALRRVAQLIESEVRRGDVAIRTGGDEVVVLLPEADAEEAGAIAERVLERVANEAELPSISVGISTWHSHSSLEDMLAEADRR